jgi:REP element-mobilizing transposase RayT
MSDPLAYFITFSTYGVWLHGRAEGSVDRLHNEPFTPFLPPDPALEAKERADMIAGAYHLDAPRRRIVLDTIREVCRHRGWRLLAAQVRGTHVHMVVHAAVPPEKVMNDCKAYASRRLTEAGFDGKDAKRWSRHGSTKYIWDETYLHNAIRYTLHGQGDPMERHAEDEAVFACEPPPEPRPSEPRP